MLKTSLYDAHIELGAKMVDFAGWSMPIHYGSQIEEHHAVRQNAGMFDVSHMCVIDLKGLKTQDFLRYLLANDVAKLTLPGKALYSCILNEKAGIIDDLIVYFIEPNFFRLVVNAGTRQKDLAWIQQQAKAFDIEVTERTDLAIIAVQGPNARAKVDALFSAEQQILLAQLKVFQGTFIDNIWLARTGYTGEDGYEIILPADRAVAFWQKLHQQGVTPCGLGARDTLRLEASMNLYGSDMDENTHPLEANLAWTIAFEPNERDFIGRKALEQIRAQGTYAQQIAIILDDKGVMRSHQKILVEGFGEGEITSGTFSPTLQKSIALARAPKGEYSLCQVEIRGKLLNAHVVKAPFVRQGKILVK